MSKCWILQSNSEGRISMTEWQKANFHDYALQHPKQQYKLEPLEKKRSLSQNAYYHVYLDVISRETGNSANDLHELFKMKLLPKRIVNIKGKKNTHEFERIGSTTELNKTEFGEFLDKIVEMTEIPLPDREEAGYYIK
jgi:hypothetical protein